MSDSLINNPHDKFFKSIFSRKELAGEFFRKHLPGKLVNDIDWQSLDLEAGSYIDESLKSTESDLLYRVRIEGKECCLYTLFEHQTQPDRLMAFRLLRYMVRIWEQHLKQNADGTKLPLIVPIVLHQGKTRWNVDTSFIELVEVPENLQDVTKSFIPDFRYEVVDLAGMPVEKIEGHVAYRMALSLMKASREDRLLDWLRIVSDLCEKLLQEQDGNEILRTFFRYMMEIDGQEAIDIEVIQSTIKQDKIKQHIMSIADKLRIEGRTEGHLDGEIHAYQKMLGEGLTSPQELESKTQNELQELLESLEQRMQARLRS